MEVDELMRRAWEAVKKAGVPEGLQEAAFKEAVVLLRDEESGVKRPVDEPQRRPTATRRKTARKSTASAAESQHDEHVPAPDEATFFSRLADESGVDEQDLRDIMQVTKDRKVHITVATRSLGSSKAEQAKSVIALVGAARAIGLEEDPVDAEAVRQEAKRKRCFDKNNFAGKSLTPMKGFNAGSNRTEIVLTSKWVDEFKDAVDKAHGRSPTKAETTSG
jgi:hypothetical protein